MATITALLARLLARQSWRVLALDADPQMNLPYALGLPAEQARALMPLSENADYVEEKTGARPGQGWGLFFRLNPDVDDVVERFGVIAPDAVRLLVMGNTVQPAAGCLCPENALLAAVVNAIALREDEAILMDTQAGFEHFGRALARGFLHALVITDPSFNGIQAALHAARLARDLEIGSIHLVVNSVREDHEFELALKRLEDEGDFPFASRHRLPYDERLRQCEPSVEPLLDDIASPLMVALTGLLAVLTSTERMVPGSGFAFDPVIEQIAHEWGDKLPCVS
jgi:CO dehydrogenase maturation factor